MILSHTLYTNVNGIADVVDKVRQFAESVGWTTHEHKTGFVFGSIGGTGRSWKADVHGAYLCLTSPGQGGSQNLVAKLEVGNYLAGYIPPVCSASFASWHTDDYRLLCNMSSSVDYLDGTGTATYMNPVSQFGLCNGRNDDGSSGADPYEYCAHSMGVSLPNDTVIPKLWVFGNSHWICGVALIDGFFCTMFHFGSFEMFDVSPTQGLVAGHTWVAAETTPCPLVTTANYGKYIARWDLYGSHTPPVFTGPFSPFERTIGRHPAAIPDRKPMAMYWDNQRSMDISVGAGSDDVSVRQTLNLDRLCGVDSDWDDFLVYDKALTKHTSNNRKPMAKCIYYWPRQSDGVCEPVCQTPCFFMSSAGLDFGETLDYDGDQYMCFPMVTKANDWAVAFRIA